MSRNSKIYRNRQFELLVAKMIQAKMVRIPTYLSVGQEHIPVIVSEAFPNSYIFPQHRCHSWFLSYGGHPQAAIKQILGIVDWDSNGMQGSASLSIRNKMFGHSGLLGDQIPIAVGFSDSKRKHTICVAGDAAVEEDYALGAFGYAVTKQCPILFIVEDNNLSILTEKSVRRSWSIVDVCEAMGMQAYNVSDDMDEILHYVYHVDKTKPTLLNINTKRHLWHAGAGQDSVPEYDIMKSLRIDGIDMDLIDIEMEKLWQEYCPKQ